MEKVCQSCGMPMSDESLFGNGAFYKDETMEEMIETCIPFMVEQGMPAEQAKEILENTLPQLKRWKQ
jgi:hypothetical protein